MELCAHFPILIWCQIVVVTRDHRFSVGDCGDFNSSIILYRHMHWVPKVFCRHWLKKSFRIQWNDCSVSDDIAINTGMYMQ